MIYLDYSATTPVNDDVLDTFVKVNKNYIGNPNSLHKLGLESKRLIDASTKQIASILNILEKEIIYTSGATEANNTAIIGIAEKYQNRGRQIITTKLEHSSILETLKYLEKKGFKISYVKLDKYGRVDLNDLKNLLKEDTVLVTIASISSELGIIQPIEEIGKIIKENKKTFFHCDMTQSIGKQTLSFDNIDLASFSAQKFYGLKGVGCLIKKENIVIEPLIHGGKSTTIYRSGTPSPALIASTAKALRLCYKNLQKKQEHVKQLNKYLLDNLSKEDIYINSNKYSIENIINISLKNIKSETMLHALEEENIFISTTTACSTSNKSLSVYEITKDEERAKKSLRISISPLTTKEEIDKFISVFKTKLKELTSIKIKTTSNKNS